MASQFQNCSGFDDHQLKIINLTLSITGSVGMLVAGVIWTVLLCVKAYKTVLQRLFIYGVLSTFTHEATHAASIEHQFKYKYQDQVCSHLGFLNNWTIWIVSNFHMCIVAYLLFVVYTQVRGDPFPRLSHSKSGKRTLEVACVLLSIFLPVTILWIPYLYNEYGLDVSWCWMKEYTSDCNSTSLTSLIVFGYSSFEVVGFVGLVTAVGIVVVYCKLAARFANAKRLLRQVLILVLAIITFMVVLNIMLQIDIFKSKSPSFAKEIYFALAITIKDLIFLSGYLVTFYSPKCRKKRKATSLGFPQGEEKGGKEYGTFKESDRTSALSYTDFQVQYTGGFTDI